MRAAMRPRPTAGDDVDEGDKKTAAAKPTQPTPPPGVPSARAKPKPQDDGKPDSDAEKSAVEKAEVAKTDEKSVAPISERRPEEPLPAEERRARAYRNVSRIAEAMTKYMEEHPRSLLPRARRDPATGLETLSWRVELLPYLGYQSLYEKFDFNKPWYVEPNKSLLEFIPDEYVSPERFDTMTNIQVPAADKFMYGANVRGRTSNVEDGMQYTLMLVEVDDDLAVQWTAPEDYAPENINRIGNDIGSLREDGTFAAWGNGWITALPKDAKNDDLRYAFTAESGDRIVLKELHRRVKIKNLSDGALATNPLANPDDMPDAEDETAQPVSEPIAPQEDEIVFNREPLPDSTAISESIERLRQIYSDQIEDADDDSSRRSLATKLLTMAKEIEGKPADVVVLLKKAQQLAVESAEAELLIQATDQYIGKFEVDPYEENMKALLDFIAGTARRDPETIETNPFIRRSVRVISAAISENDYLRASNLARHCAQYTAKKSDDELRSKFNRLRGLLGGANNAFKDAKEHLATYRINPDNTRAGSQFGQFLCFYKGDWETGLPLLKLSPNSDLAGLAEADLKGGETAEDYVALGDAWWAMSRRAGGVYRQGAQDRAVFWYNRAFPIMPQSLDRMHVKHQLQEADKDTTSSPIAVAQDISNDLNIDLASSLAAVASGVHLKKRFRSDDD